MPAGYNDLLSLTGALLAASPLTPTAGYVSVMALCGVYVTSGGEEAAASTAGSIPTRRPRRMMPVEVFVGESDDDEWMLLATILGGS